MRNISPKKENNNAPYTNREDLIGVEILATDQKYPARNIIKNGFVSIEMISDPAIIERICNMDMNQNNSLKSVVVFESVMMIY